MKVIPFYVTEDGKQFTCKVDARKHEVELEAVGVLRNLLKSSIESSLTRSGNIDNVLRHMLMEASEIRAVLQSYVKKMPKEERSKAA